MGYYSQRSAQRTTSSRADLNNSHNPIYRNLASSELPRVPEPPAVGILNICASYGHRVPEIERIRGGAWHTDERFHLTLGPWSGWTQNLVFAASRSFHSKQLQLPPSLPLSLSPSLPRSLAPSLPSYLSICISLLRPTRKISQRVVRPGPTEARGVTGSPSQPVSRSYGARLSVIPKGQTVIVVKWSNDASGGHRGIGHQQHTE